MSDPSELPYPKWQATLLEVILEFDQEKLSEKAQRTETAILERLRELRQSSDSQDEKEAIGHGLSLLRSIKSRRLGYPDWE